MFNFHKFCPLNKKNNFKKKEEKEEKTFLKNLLS